MKRLIIIFLAVLFLASCAKDDSYISSNVIRENGELSFEELLMLVNVKASDSTYLVVSSIDSINIFINNYYWAKINSISMDTSKVEKFVSGNNYVTTKKLNYLVVANQDVAEPDYTMAYQFADYLNASYNLKPGEYACLIESFMMKFNDGTVKKFYPMTYSIFKVEDNSRSAYIGEIELSID